MNTQHSNNFYMPPKNDYLFNHDVNDFNGIDLPSIMSNGRGNGEFVEVMSYDDLRLISPKETAFYEIADPKLQNLRGEAIERPHSAPLMNEYYASSAASSPLLSDMPVAQEPAPLTAAQKAAFAQIQEQQKQQTTVAGLETSKYDTTELKQLAAQMQNVSSSQAAELRRQMHIQCEQKRRAQIKNGFEDLKMELPGFQHKKLSKAVILLKATEFIQKMKQEREFLLQEIERLRMQEQSLQLKLN